MMWKVLHLYGIFPKAITPVQVYGKHQTNSYLRVILQNIWPVLLKIVKVTKNKEKSEKLL